MNIKEINEKKKKKTREIPPTSTLNKKPQEKLVTPPLHHAHLLQIQLHGYIMKPSPPFPYRISGHVKGACGRQSKLLVGWEWPLLRLHLLWSPVVATPIGLSC